MNNNQDNFVYTPQQETPIDNQFNNMENQQVINKNPPLQNPSQQLNVIPHQENINNSNNHNNNNQEFNQPINNLNNNENINQMNQNIPSNINNEIINNNINNSNNALEHQDNNIYNIYNDLNQNNIYSNSNNNRLNFNGVFSNQASSIKDNMSDEDYDMINPQIDNKFINSKFDTTSTTLTDLNIDPNAPKIDYMNDKKVQENINNDEKRKNTMAITEEAKIFLIIIAVLCVFVFVMPYIFDAIINIG